MRTTTTAALSVLSAFTGFGASAGFGGPAVAAAMAVAAAAAPAVAQDDPYLEDVRAGERYLLKGKLARARLLFDEILADFGDTKGTPEAPSPEVVRACRRGLLELDLRAGEYDTVLAAFDAMPESERRLAPFRHLALDAALRRGRHERAAELCRAILAADENDFRARCRLGEVLAETGKPEEARAAWEAAVDRSRRSSVRGAEDLTWIARCHMNLGGRRAMEQASGLLVESIRVAPDQPEPRVLYGWLRYLAYGEWEGAKSGEDSLKQVLQNNGEYEEALVTLYRIRRSNHLLDGGKTEQFLERALAANPNSVPALLERAITWIDDRRFSEGQKLLDRALEINPNDKRVLAQRSAVALLQGQPDEAREFRERVLSIDAAFTGVDTALGDRLVALYRFGDAVPHYRAALDREPESVDALHGLAKALVYAGQGEEAAALLERAKEIEPGFVNPWRNNVLAVQELLEQDYDKLYADGFAFLMHREDRDVLEQYLLPYYRDAREVLGEKYGYTADVPVRVEVFKTWDDFSVRTIGFRGFTALGACFGPMITLVSPGDADLRRNDFMWSATVWHEYAHVMTLWLSKHRVPRWLTEGISVYEERVKNPTWERGMERDLLDAFHNGEIPPVRLLNRVFRSPRIIFGYYQGGLIVELLSRDFGFDKVVEMLRRYAEDQSTETIFEETFGISTREFDRRFLEFVRKKIDGLRIVPRYGDRKMEALRDAVQKEPTDAQSHLKLAWALLMRGIAVDAAHHLRMALQAEPDSAEAQLVYAELLRRRESFDEAVAAYEKGFDGGADDFESRVRYGGLLQERGAIDAAIRQFQAAKRCWPTCSDQSVAPELLLSRLYAQSDRETEAMMELQAFCRKTARAFQPRLELAEYARKAGDRRQEVALLEEANQIDPFMRSLHERLADAYVAVGRTEDAIVELQVALAVKPSMDREHLRKPAEEVPRVDAPEYLARQAETCVRLARLLHGLGQEGRARKFLERAIGEAPQSDAAETARELLEQWYR